MLSAVVLIAFRGDVNGFGSDGCSGLAHQLGRIGFRSIQMYPIRTSTGWFLASYIYLQYK